MNRLFILIFLMVSTNSCLVFKSKYQRLGSEGFVNKNKFQAYSAKGEEFKPLQNLFIKADSISYIGDVNENLYGNNDLVFKKYRLSIDLRLLTKNHSIDKSRKRNKVYAQKIDFELSILNNSVKPLYLSLLDKIYKMSQVEPDTFMIDFGVLKYTNGYYAYVNESLYSEKHPLILCNQDKAILLRIAPNSRVGGDYVVWVESYIMDDLVRGVLIKENSSFIAPSFSNLIDKKKFIELFDNNELYR